MRRGTHFIQVRSATKRYGGIWHHMRMENCTCEWMVVACAEYQLAQARREDERST